MMREKAMKKSGWNKQIKSVKLNRPAFLVVLIVIVLGVGGWFGWQAMRVSLPVSNSTEVRMRYVTFFAETEIDTIDRIQIFSPQKKEIELLKSPTDWRKVLTSGESVPLTDQRVRKLFHRDDGKAEIVANMRGLIQNDSSNEAFQRSGLMVEDATRVDFYQGDQHIESILLGQTLWRDGKLGTFVRRPSSRQIAMIDENLLDNFRGDRLEDWADDRVFAGVDFDKLFGWQVESISSKSGYRMIRGDGESAWQVEFDGALHEAESERVELAIELLRRLSIVRSTVEAPEIEKFDSSHGLRLTLLGDDLEPMAELIVGTETIPSSGEWLARLSGYDNFFTIYRLYAINRPPVEFVRSSNAMLN